MKAVPVGNLPPVTFETREVNGDAAQARALWDVVRQYTGHPQLVAWVAKLLKANDVPERNPRAFARALQRYSQDHIQFHRERPERFASPLRTLEWGLGDCDDKTILIATALRTFRVPVRAKFLRFERDGRRFAHVYPEVQLDGSWEALESVHPWALGDDPAERARARGARITRVQTIGP